LQFDVHFGDVYLKAKRAQAANVCGEVVEVRGVTLADAHVHLEADAVHGDAIAQEVAKHCVDGVRLATHAFGAEVVVEQVRIRVGLVCPPKGIGEVARAKGT
jgi:hypothetical protein